MKYDILNIIMPFWRNRKKYVLKKSVQSVRNGYKQKLSELSVGVSMYLTFEFMAVKVPQGIPPE